MQMTMIATHRGGFGRGTMSCVGEGEAQTGVGSRENLKCAVAAFTVSLVAAKNHSYEEQLPTHHGVLHDGVGTSCKKRMALETPAVTSQQVKDIFRCCFIGFV